jgi:hypothetical protein
MHLGRATNHGGAKNGWSLGNESFPGALRSSYAPLHSRSRFIASLAMNIVRLMVFFVLGLLLGVLLPSLVTWLLG